MCIYDIYIYVYTHYSTINIDCESQTRIANSQQCVLVCERCVLWLPKNSTVGLMGDVFPARLLVNSQDFVGSWFHLH